MNRATAIRRKSTSSLLGATALATMLLASPAFAAECSSGSPPPPAPAAGSGSSTAGPNPVSVSITGAAGCSGKSADSFHSGNDGGQGQGIDPSSIEMTGGSISSSGAAIGVSTTGGAGGDGSGDSSLGINTTAGSGATGGYGGDWTATIASGATLSASGTVISVVSTGGAGGTGATGWNNGSGGTGGAGGAISNFSLASGSRVTSMGSAAAIIIQSLGGAGGHQNGSGRAADNVGESAGTGGGAGAMTVHIDGSVSSSSGDGVSITARGGDGGSTDSVTSGGAASGTKGGNGGNGATSINFESSGMIGVGGTAISIINSGGNGNGGAYAGAGAVGKGGNGGAGGNGGGITAAAAQIIQGNIGMTLAANGGSGGNGGSADGLGGTTGGAGGAGGTGGSIGLTPAGAVVGLASGITAAADGGAGGNGASAGAITSKGGGGGVGGAGGSTTITLSGQTTSMAFGVQASANGGNGGAGGKATSATDSNGGSGGTGGAGGSGSGGATVNLLASGSVTTQGQDVPTQTTVIPGILVQSNGGVGGASGSESAVAGQAGGAGIGGAGGLAVANIAGNVTTSGSFAHGVMAQSVAGIGGGAGHTGDVWSTGGATGGQGGNGGTATVTSTGGTVTTTGTGSMGIIAQSVGGGGGAGGNASSNEDSLGGDAGAGGNGGASTLTLAGTVITRGDQGGAALSQSIGGSGGVGGSANGNGVEVTVTIGGDGNNGGTGGVANATNSALLTTFGAKSGGLMAQSVGGGGGNGGAGIGKTNGTNLAVNVTIGGSGGNGGSGGQVTLTNNFQVTTYGSDSYGVKAQTIGGGGGEGGAASGTAKATAGGDANAISMTASIGGSGGSGGDGSSSPLLLTNYGFVATAGDGGIGLMAHNIAGGGGNGGDSSAASYSDGTTTSNTTSITLGMGGSGGVGGTGGQSTLNNKALVLTLGESAYGMLVQSIGGGGGQGSGGDSSASTTPSNLTGKFVVTLGGNGGGGGTGGAATGDNAGGIATAGDGARGMMVQSIGGGGGAAGGAAGKANGAGGLSIDVTLGGSGGTGGVGGSASGSNHLGIQTTGADADGMFVQSVGGGGGSGGKAASTNGGATDASDLNHQLQTGFQKGLNLKETVTLVAGTTDVYQIGDGKLASVNGISDLQKVLNSTKVATVSDDDGDGSTTGSLTLNLKIGNSGGTGGNGGTATAYNEGAIRTNGGKSDGIFVQSVGGGGGAGGAVTFTDSAKNTASIVLGGQGGAAGDGNSVLLTNAAEAEVYTSGATSSALVAQSIGGGGGKGGITASKAGALSNLTVTLGGTGGSSGSGKDVTVNTDVSSYLGTQGKNAVGIIAQSVGGGGITSVLSKDQTGPAGDPDPSSADVFGFHLSFGDTNASTSSDGGTVTVGAPTENTAFGIGKITTAGRNAYGILAQSVGGGGGIVQGGNPTGTSFFGTGTMKGNGNTVQVTVGNALSTSGVGAVGVFAQSIGGGGGLVGDTGWTQQRQAFAENGTHIGNGGNVSVTIDPLGSITTSAPNTPGIWAQSIGGGGGLVNTTTGPAYAGSAGGTGTGGTIDITVNGKLTVTGIASNGILAQSLGDSTSTSPITVTIGATGNLQAGVATQPQYGDGTSAGVYIDHGGLTAATPNKVTNNGTLFTYAAGTNSVAVWSTGGYTQVFNNGTMGGDILLQNNGGQGCFTNGTMANGQPASFVSGDSVAVGACGVSNFGIIHIKGSTTGTTTITGDYTGHGQLIFDADFAGGTADKLVVNGKARIGDTLTIQPSSISNRSAKLLMATDTLTLDPSLAMADSSHLYDFKTQVAGNELSVMPVANFAAKASGFGANEKAVAANLQALFDGGASADLAFTRLLGVADDAGYAEGLGSLAGQGLGAFGAFRFNSSRTFAANLYGGCQELQLQSRTADRCFWGRALLNTTTQTAGTDTLGYTADAFGLQKGMQLPLSDNLALTGSIAYENTKFRDGRGSARIAGDSLVGGLGLLFTPARWELSAGIDAAYGWYKSQRTINLGLTEQVNARPEQSQVGVHVRAAINVLDGDSIFLRPFVEGHAIHVSNKAFTEMGASPFRLAVEGQSDTAFISTAGLEMGTKLPISTTVTLRPFASAALEYGSPRSWTTTARFADQPQGDSFDLKTAGPETLGRFSIGADLLGAKNVAFSVQYAPELGKGFTSHSGTARLTIAF